MAEQTTDPVPSPVEDTQREREEALTATVVASFAGCPDPRLRAVMGSLVHHLHAFLREARPTEAEWAAGIDFLTRCGHITDERRQEFVLLSDVLGVSMQTIAVNNPAAGEATEATVLGPFFVADSPRIEIGGDSTGGASGEPCWVEGTVTGTDGEPVPGARLEVWQADDDGLYDVQYGDDRTAGRAHLVADEQGRYAFWAVTPTPYPIPHDGPVGDLLAATGRSPMRAAHLHLLVTAPGRRRLVTHVFVAGDELLDADAVFGVKDSLVRTVERPGPEVEPPPGRPVTPGGWSRVRFDVCLAPETAPAPAD